jgi:type IV secretory pathway VirB4 component
LPPSVLSTKDFIAPSSFDFSDKRSFGMGTKHAAVCSFQITAGELKDYVLTDYLNMDSCQVISMQIQPIDQIAAIKDIKRKMTDLDSMKIAEQKKAVRAGYDMEILPSDLNAYGGDARKLLEKLSSQDERMFLVTILMMHTASTKRQLALDVKQAQSIAQQHNCNLVRMDFQQENGLASCLPLGMNRIEIQRGIPTSGIAAFVPFTTMELRQRGKEALYYGLNALSNNLIMVDRKLLKNPNGLILGTPGSGKSFAAKREITNCFLITTDDIIVCDPESEVRQEVA